MMSRFSQFMNQERLATDKVTAFKYFAKTFILGGVAITISRKLQIKDDHSYSELFAENVRNWAASWLPVSPSQDVLLIEEAHRYVDDMNERLYRLQSDDLATAASLPIPTASPELTKFLRLDEQPAVQQISPDQKELTIADIFSQDFTTTTTDSPAQPSTI